MEQMTITPIAHIETDFKDKFGIPRQSGRVPSLEGRIVFEPGFRNPDSLRGIADFSHLWLIFDFSKAHRAEWSPTVRPPRLGGNQRVGVFATRSPFRPNPIGLSCVQLLRIKQTAKEGTVLIVGGVDLLDRTPILDIKPYIPYADCYPDAKGSFAQEYKEYSLQVHFPQHLLTQLPADKQEAAVACLKDDPRPSYQDDEERIYSMEMAGFDIHFQVKGTNLFVTGIDINTSDTNLLSNH